MQRDTAAIQKEHQRQAEELEAKVRFERAELLRLNREKEEREKVPLTITITTLAHLTTRTTP